MSTRIYKKKLISFSSLVFHFIFTRLRRISLQLSWYSRGPPLKAYNSPPPDYLFFQKLHTRTFLLQPLGLLIFWTKRTSSQPDPELSGESNSWSGILPNVCCLENVCMIKSQFSHHSLSYVRSKWNKLRQDTTQDRQFFQPLPPHLFTLKLFSNSPVYCYPLLFRTGES